ncbi:MAG: PAS domain S-box protein, partial [Desulfomonilaceae bacterium]
MSADLPQVSDFLKERAFQVMKTGEVESTDFYRNINDNSIYLACLVPIVDPDNSKRFIATLVLLIDPQQFIYPFIKYWPTESKSAETILVRRDGDEVVYLNDLKFRKNVPLERRIPVANLESPAVKAVLGQEGIVQGIGYNGETVIADVCQITGTPWYLESRIDKSEVYAPLRQQLWLTIFIVGSLIGGAGAFVGWLWNRQNASFYRQRYEASNALKEITLLNEARLQSLYEISQYKFEDDQDLLNFTLEQAIRITGSKIGHLRPYDEVTQVFNLITYSKEVTKECKVANHKPVRKLEETGLWAEAVRQRKAIVVNDYKAPNPYKKGQPEGHVELVRYMATPVFYADKIVAVVGVANKESDYNDTDIMQLSLLMEAAWRIIENHAAREQERKLIIAVEQSADSIVITDSTGTIIYVNPAVEKITGYDSTELIGQNPRVFKSDEHDQSFYKGLWDTITDGKTWSGRFVNRRKDGVTYQEEATISPVLNAVGKITNFVAVKRDVTKNLELQAQLFQAQKMEAIGTLAGGFAHDFNNLLQVILGYLDLILSGQGLP